MLNLKHIGPTGDESIVAAEAAQFIAARLARDGSREPAKIRLRQADGTITHLTDPGRYYVTNAAGVTIASYVLHADQAPPAPRPEVSAIKRGRG